jgi:hypothetical protein
LLENKALSVILRLLSMAVLCCGLLASRPLLGAISLNPAASSIIDPMAGHGDLLDAVAERAARNGQQLAQIHGVEIDPPTAVLCRERMEGWRHRVGNLAIRAGDAFDPRLAQTYLVEGYDLVIANPPYVRYQTLAAQNGNIPQLSPDEIRRPAPRGPKVRQYRNFGMLQHFIELLTIHFQGLVYGRQRRLAIATSSGISEMFCRNPVLLSALFACPNERHLAPIHFARIKSTTQVF